MSRPRKTPDSRSGIDPKTGEWTPAFPGQRPPVKAELGNDLSLRHGAYATVKLGDRVDELADSIRDLVPGYSPADEVALRLLCLTLARLERAEAALEEAGLGEMGRLRQDALGWANAARRILNDLALTPTARARLGLDVARTEETLADYVARKRADDDGGDA